ncbi:MAG: excinuclease ABC subunit UvrA, partial [Verrucomicrobiota bacterium]
MSESSILVAGAREHNLKNITVKIPRNRITVVTGLSGSGKSSLAFDTLYAEGQRKYVESLSAYARQFLNQLQKPDVDHISGLSPAIAIEQRTAGSNPRSIVATSTEIHDYLRLLFSATGKQHCPECGRPVGRQSVDQIVNSLISLPNRSRLFLLAPLVSGKKGRHEALLDGVKKQGFVRVRIDGEIYELEEAPALAKNRKHSIDIVIDRMIITGRIRSRLTDSVELALKHGSGTMKVLSEKSRGRWEEFFYSEKHACPVCGISFEELSPRHFSFNSPYGACSGCSGIGAQLVFDEDLIVPDTSISIDDGAITAWRRGGRRLIIYYKRLLGSLSKHYGFSTSTPYKKLSPRIRKIIMYGSGDEEVEQGFWRSGSYRRRKKPFEGVIPNLQRRYDTTDSDYTRQRLRRYMSRQHCPQCKGKRLKPEVLA